MHFSISGLQSTQSEFGLESGCLSICINNNFKRFNVIELKICKILHDLYMQSVNDFCSQMNDLLVNYGTSYLYKKFASSIYRERMLMSFYVL